MSASNAIISANANASQPLLYQHEHLVDTPLVRS